MWFDSHCHLHTVAEREPLEEVLLRARGERVNDVLSLGLDAVTSQQVLDLTAHEGVWAGAAFHPSETRGWQNSWIEPIDRLLDDPKVVAVGETGIDHYWDRDFDSDQEAAFRAHIELSKKHDKALVIHTRESLDATLAIVNDAGAPDRLVFHCWSGDAGQLASALQLGSYISFAGNSTFKKNAPLRDLAALVPSDRILVETDAPYLTPEPHRGKSNEPAFVVHVGEALAHVRGEDVETFAETTTHNARTLFGL
ncbi:MAG: TatD family hydrolase [Actinobacteria bacterium]|nr:TatD family hydrolase [Actinomycetota bacterium]